MIFSKACEYGIRSALYVANRNENEFVPIREIGDGLGISHHFLTKVLQDLTRAQIMKSLRGPRGGVALNGPPEVITLFDIIIAIEGAGHFDGCVLGLPSCDSNTPCPLHVYWGDVRDDIKKKFQSVSIKSLSDRVSEDGMRISSAVQVLAGP